jgi:hypothetical protein
MGGTGCPHPQGTTTTMKEAVRVATTLVTVYHTEAVRVATTLVTVYHTTQRGSVIAKSRVRS